MKIPRATSKWYQSFPSWMVATLCLFPSVLSAHPGHDHLDEIDEFDVLRATFFHSHGALDYILAAILISCIAVACYNGKSAVRVSAAALALAALAMLPIL